MLRRHATGVALVLLALAATATRADTPGASSLRAAAEAFVADGDLARARASLETLGASPAELLAALREVPRPDAPAAGGTRTLELLDGSGRKTDLVLVAPSAEALKNQKKPLGLAVLLHGLGGRGRNAAQWAERLAATGEFACVAPTAQPLDKEDVVETDGFPDLVRSRFKHWWAYENPRSFPLEAIRKAQELLWIDPDRIVLAGASMGGYGTWNIGLRRPDRFAALVPLCGGIAYFSPVSDKHAPSLALLENGRTVPILAAHGNKDFIVPIKPDKEACARLGELGGKVIFKELDAGHDLGGIQNGDHPLLQEVTQFITSAKRETSPEQVTYVQVSEKLDGAYWLRIVERRQDAKFPKVEGKVDREANRISVRLDGVKKARVFLDERLLDARREVEILVNDRPAWRGRLVPSAEAVLESWKSRRDPGLVYQAFVDVAPKKWF